MKLKEKFVTWTLKVGQTDKMYSQIKYTIWSKLSKVNEIMAGVLTICVHVEACRLQCGRDIFEQSPEL